MFYPTDRQIAIGAMFAAVAASVIAGVALWQSFRQFDLDYDSAVLLTPGQLPIRRIPSSDLTNLELTVTNTSKVNVSHYLRASANTLCVDGEDNRPQLIPCTYQSSVIPLSKVEAGKNAYSHKLKIAAPARVDMHPLAQSSDPKYDLTIDIVDARNGKILKHSKCYYTFEADSRSFVLYEPVMDSSGESKRLQAACEG